jgi:hypothetical protein
MAMKNPTWSRAEECSKRILTQIAANVKRGIPLETAVESWTEAINERNDPAARREHQRRSRVTPYLIPDDVATLNTRAVEQGKGGRSSDMMLPIEAREDILRVEVIVPPSNPEAAPSRPSYSTGPRPRKTKKRKRLQGEEGDEAGGESHEQTEGSWVKLGKRSIVKRVRNHRILKAVDDTEAEDGESDNQNTLIEQPKGGCLTPPSAQPSKTTAANTHSKTRRRLTCDGPAVALMFRKFIELGDEMPFLDNNKASK